MSPFLRWKALFGMTLYGCVLMTWGLSWKLLQMLRPLPNYHHHLKMENLNLWWLCPTCTQLAVLAAWMKALSKHITLTFSILYTLTHLILVIISSILLLSSLYKCGMHDTEKIIEMSGVTQSISGRRQIICFHDFLISASACPLHSWPSCLSVQVLPTPS